MVRNTHICAYLRQKKSLFLLLYFKLFTFPALSKVWSNDHYRSFNTKMVCFSFVISSQYFTSSLPTIISIWVKLISILSTPKNIVYYLFPSIECISIMEANLHLNCFLSATLWAERVYTFYLGTIICVNQCFEQNVGCALGMGEAVAEKKKKKENPK